PPQERQRPHRLQARSRPHQHPGARPDDEFELPQFPYRRTEIGRGLFSALQGATLAPKDQTEKKHARGTPPGAFLLGKSWCHGESQRQVAPDARLMGRLKEVSPSHISSKRAKPTNLRDLFVLFFRRKRPNRVHVFTSRSTANSTIRLRIR